MAANENTTSALNSLLNRAAAIEAQIYSCTDDEEHSDLVNDLVEANNRVAGALCFTLDDVRAKAAHLLRMIEEEIDPIDQHVLPDLLKSLAARS